MAVDIRHQGVVDNIDGQTVIVRITQTAACGGCQARDICHSAEPREKLVEVHSADVSGFRIGQTVTVSGAESSGMRAVWLAFGLPLILLVLALTAVVALTGSEKTAVISVLLVLVPYYIVLYLFRERLKRVFQFRIIG
ncbi:MAG: SoxR reducing system RseC family protein [Bacteroidaceae bacterium]|nr:SoxR reducing system RseC family protein [Bacteroidaceae bacterium]